MRDISTVVQENGRSHYFGFMYIASQSFWGRWLEFILQIILSNVNIYWQFLLDI